MVGKTRPRQLFLFPRRRNGAHGNYTKLPLNYPQPSKHVIVGHFWPASGTSFEWRFAGRQNVARDYYMLAVIMVFLFGLSILYSK